MVVPVADQERLRAILAFDLQPRIQWAYDLEQDVDGLGAGYVTVGNGDPNGLVTKPEGYLFLDLTTPAVWQNQNGGTVWTDISAGGGPGDLTDAVILAPTTSARNVIEGTGDITSLTVKATGDEGISTATFQVLDSDDNDALTLEMDSATNAGNIMRVHHGDGTVFFQGFHVPGVTIQSSFSLNDNVEGMYIEDLVDPSQSECWLYVQALEGQVVPLMRFDGEVDTAYGVGNEVFKVLVTGAVVSNAVDEPADDVLGNVNRESGLTYWLDDTAGAPTIKFKAKDVNGDLFTATIPMTAV